MTFYRTFALLVIAITLGYFFWEEILAAFAQILSFTT